MYPPFSQTLVLQNKCAKFQKSGKFPGYYYWSLMGLKELKKQVIFHVWESVSMYSLLDLKEARSSSCF